MAKMGIEFQRPFLCLFIQTLLDIIKHVLQSIRIVVGYDHGERQNEYQRQSLSPFC